MDEVEQGAVEKKCSIGNRKDRKRRISRHKYWNIPVNESFISEISYYKEIQKIKKGSIDFAAPDIKRYYRKVIVTSKLPLVELKLVDNESENLNSSSAVLVDGMPLSAVPCSYTERLLKPFIFQDFESRPLWLNMHDEFRSKVIERFPSLRVKKVKKHPINYMYIQKQHIQAINVLAEQYFWPGIDVSSALWYPEFSCVALYKKLVVGFGIMTPGLYLNEGYINFLFVRPHWRSSGIASFILYHLTQTCISWNITLHTSLSNDALLLYNKFTFKVHQMIRDFYDKRLSLSGNESGHAFYMQLHKY
ncbi:cysteine-rich protein 2-binding protein [Halyomorpha halys]|uniref:cysteine-rich protein 2-binding protein n=1 Tax=Halyomorpha halys TaxID=286706 RepID=UPI0006D52490|nr:cysteine-rich protein 2-binding protein [Halyomorpha halys]